MNKLLQQVIEELEKLPEEEQKAIASRLLVELQVKNTKDNPQITTFERDQSASQVFQSRWEVDLSVYNRDNQLILIVEVKRRSKPSLDWVIELSQKIFESQNFPRCPYLMLVFTDSIYLWSNLNHQKQIAEPSYIIDATPIFQPYFEQVGVTANKISGQSFEMIVASWLREIIHSSIFPNVSDQSQQWLVDSGLGKAIAGGYFQYEDIA
ncbi:conserved hypothetical protein [Planktothrix sp. PCC 11201]|uniref:hypothetical protein n=1 Tax=Planktothrix sp. PCC 11201 TaxID=1729650 RepID=UPI00091D44A6|nr:hypothetical protein [Planktothrix sp. PCC 11201]SKB13418.1 conserved hypothetical protein [Planktothrix sp. PCC 11201]